MNRRSTSKATVITKSEEFLGKRVIVAGAADPSGNAIVNRFAKGGAYVAVADKDLASAQEVANGIVGAMALEVNPLLDRDFEAMARETIEAFGRVDILINNFGSPIEYRPTSDITPEEFDWTINQNVRSVFLACKYVVPSMSPGSTIINVIPMSNHRNTSPLWEAVKGSLVTMTRGLAWELAPGIRINAVCALEGPDAGQSSPMQRLIRADDVAAAVCFLASPLSGFLAGVCLNVDGGAQVK